jgi:hypothetical protein
MLISNDEIRTYQAKYDKYYDVYGRVSGYIVGECYDLRVESSSTIT